MRYKISGKHEILWELDKNEGIYGLISEVHTFPHEKRKVLL